MKRPNLKTTWQTWKSNGIFVNLSAHAVPWAADASITAANLDLDYFAGHSGNKRASPLVMSLVETSTDGALSADDCTVLANTAYGLYHDRWSRMWEQMQIEYNPINNYDMIEEEQSSGSHSGSDAHAGTDTTTTNMTQTNGGTDAVTTSNTQTHDGTDTTTNQGTVKNGGTNTTDTKGNLSTENGIAGFNSSTFNNDTNSSSDSEATSTTTINETRTDDLQQQQKYGHTVTDAGTQSTQHGHTVADAGTVALQHGETITTSGTESGTRTLTRSGNIGVTTTAQMLEQERLLWAWNYFRDVVYKDLDALLTIQTY